MRLPSLKLLLVNYCFQHIFASPVSSFDTPARNNTLDLSTPGEAISIPPFLNVSQPLENLQAFRTFLPHRYRVPTTQTVIRLGSGLFRSSIDKDELESLIHVAKAVALEGYRRHGRSAVYPPSPDGRQMLSQLMLGVELVIQTYPHPARPLTWQNLYEVIEGLRLYIIVGGRNHETQFFFFNGPGYWPDVTTEPLGFGRISKVPVLDETAEE